MFRRGNPFVHAQEETSSTRRASHLRAGLSLSWPSHAHIQPNLLKSCQVASSMNFSPVIVCSFATIDSLIEWKLLLFGLKLWKRENSLATHNDQPQPIIQNPLPC